MLCSFLGRSAFRVFGLALILLVLASSLLCLKNLRTVYDQHQKFNRLKTYEKFVHEVGDYMERVGETANRSDFNLSKLQSFLEKTKSFRKTSSFKQNSSLYSKDSESIRPLVPR